MQSDDMDNMESVTGKILKRTMTPDPRDPEHEIFEIEYSFTYLGTQVVGTVKFSLNTDHVLYATLGQLLGVPKFPFDYDTFLASLAENSPVAFLVDKHNPQHYRIEWNDIANEVFRHRNVWT